MTRLVRLSRTVLKRDEIVTTASARPFINPAPPYSCCIGPLLTYSIYRLCEATAAQTTSAYVHTEQRICQFPALLASTQSTQHATTPQARQSNLPIAATIPGDSCKFKNRPQIGDEASDRQAQRENHLRNGKPHLRNLLVSPRRLTSQLRACSNWLDKNAHTSLDRRLPAYDIYWLDNPLLWHLLHF